MMAASKAREATIAAMAEISGMIGQYAQGNEPVHQDAYLYTYAGAPYKTQARVREILPKLYTNKPDGLCGNDDCGQMSAWFVLGALGYVRRRLQNLAERSKGGTDAGK